MHILANVELARLAREDNDQKTEDMHLKRAISEEARDDEQRRVQGEAMSRLAELSPTEDASKLLDAWEKLSPKDPRVAERQAALAAQVQNVTRLEAATERLQEPLRAVLSVQVARLSNRSKDVVRYLSSYLQIEKKDRSRILQARRNLALAYLELTEGRKARRVIEGALKLDPLSEEMRKIHEDSLKAGGLSIPTSVADLDNAAAYNPDSRFLQLKRIEFLFQARTAPGLRQAEALADRLLATKEDDFEALYWKSELLFRKRSFSQAEKFLVPLLSQMRSPKPGENASRRQLSVAPSVGDTWLLVAKNTRARGLVAEAKALLEEGLAKAENREDKEKLKHALSTGGGS